MRGIKEDLTLYNEFNNQKENSITNYKNTKELIEAISSFFHKAEEVYLEIERENAILNLFMKTTVSDESFFNDRSLMDTYLNRLKKYYKETKIISSCAMDNPSNAYFKVLDFLDIANEIKKEVKRFETHYYNKLKMTSFNALKGKSLEEIIRLSDDVNKFIEEYKSLEECNDFVTYNSGSLVSETVDEVIKAITVNKDKGKVNITKDYFKLSDAVINMEFLDWINLFNKLQYIFERFDSDVFSSENMVKLLHELEIRYFVILINNEKRG